MSEIRTAHSTATELATKSVMLVTDQGDLIETLTSTVESLTTQIHQLPTCMDNQASLDEARIAQAVQQYLQHGPIAPTGFTEDDIHARVISILHEQYSYPQASYLAHVEIACKCGKDSSNHRNSTFNVLYIEVSATCYNQRYKGAFPLAFSFFSISSRPPAP
jgi:hypothetical protein